MDITSKRWTPQSNQWVFLIHDKDALKVFQTPTFQEEAGIDDCDLLHWYVDSTPVAK